MTIEVDQVASIAAGVSAVEAASCHFGGGHDWIDATTITDLSAQWRCARCRAIGVGADVGSGKYAGQPAHSIRGWEPQ